MDLTNKNKMTTIRINEDVQKTINDKFGSVQKFLDLCLKSFSEKEMMELSKLLKKIG